MLAVGFSDSIVKVWTLVPQKLKAMKSAEQLQDVNVDAEDVLVGVSLEILPNFNVGCVYFKILGTNDG